MAEPRDGGKCPVCGRAVVHQFRPFCSRRCADIDLARWLRGAYAIPGDPVDPEQVLAKDDEDGADGSGRKH